MKLKLAKIPILAKLSHRCEFLVKLEGLFKIVCDLEDRNVMRCYEKFMSCLLKFECLLEIACDLEDLKSLVIWKTDMSCNVMKN